jgi:hypothetical protein
MVLQPVNRQSRTQIGAMNEKVLRGVVGITMLGALRASQAGVTKRFSIDEDRKRREALALQTKTGRHRIMMA